MAVGRTLLCIHRNPAQLSSLQEQGYQLVTATNGHDGLRLFMSQQVDGIVLEYHLGLLDGSIVAAEIKKVRPYLPIVMLADHLELPDTALESVDAVVAKTDGDRFLLASIHFVLNVKPAQQIEKRLRTKTPPPAHRPGNSGRGARLSEAKPDGGNDDRDTPFSPAVWESIWNGSIQF